ANNPPSVDPASPSMGDLMSSTPPVEKAPLDRYDPANWTVYVPLVWRDDHLKCAQKLLEDWCSTTWLSKYSNQLFGAEGILPDSILTSLATRTSYCTADDIHTLHWILAKQHTTEVLQLLKGLDQKVVLEEMVKERAQKDEEVAEREQERICKMIEAAKKCEEAAERKVQVEARRACVRAAKVAVKGIGQRQHEVVQQEAKARLLAEQEAEKAM
ncbi:hypothetical protein V8D89_008013, partial [Ganoderma adspersum]